MTFLALGMLTMFAIFFSEFLEVSMTENLQKYFLNSIFSQRDIGSQVDCNSRAGKMRKTMCQLWTNFAKYQDPTPGHSNPLSVKWNPVQPTEPEARNIDFDYLVIDEDSKMVRNVNKRRLDFWRDVYRKWNTSFLAPKL